MESNWSKEAQSRYELALDCISDLMGVMSFECAQVKDKSCEDFKQKDIVFMKLASMQQSPPFDGFQVKAVEWTIEHYGKLVRAYYMDKDVVDDIIRTVNNVETIRT